MKEQSESESWTIDKASGQRRAPVDQPGYYPGYRTLSHRKFWDAATRELIEHRVESIPPIRFFTVSELATMTAVADRILPQDDRTEKFRIPIVNAIDARLFEGKIDGSRFEDMPPDGDAYRLGLRAIEEMAQEKYAKPFTELKPIDQECLLEAIHDGKKIAAHEIWEQMSIERFWHMLIQDCVSVYYSHPWAWDEIGFGGPAYPRAYTRLEGGLPEPWEVDERRYEWEAPTNSISDHYEAPPSEHQSVSGQGGTH